MNSETDVACSVLILGLGNELLGDDGFGPEALRRLGLLRTWPKDVSLLDAGQGVSLCVGAIAAAGTVLALDAVRGGGPPGTVYEFKVGAGDGGRGVPDGAALGAVTGGADALSGPYGTDGQGWQAGPWARDPHTASFVDAVALARWLTGLPVKAVVLGVEALSFDSGAALSAPMRAVIDTAVSRAVAIIEQSLARGDRGPR